MTITVSGSTFSNPMNDSTVLFGGRDSSKSHPQHRRAHSHDRGRERIVSSTPTSSSASPSPVPDRSRRALQPSNTPDDTYIPRTRAQSLPAPQKPSLFQRTRTQFEKMEDQLETKIENFGVKAAAFILGDKVFPRGDHETRHHHRQEKRHFRTVSPNTGDREFEKAAKGSLDTAEAELLGRTIRGDQSPLRQTAEHLFSPGNIHKFQGELYRQAFGKK